MTKAKAKSKLSFKPVLTRMSLHAGTADAYLAALHASSRLTIRETPHTISFTFRKRKAEPK